ncbi:hypothetical protein UY456_23025 [Paenibacillus polymyxa]|uniref:hypothetical protein n=1 Tax=Paenibacillus polymyxa TaxID=1406 RepID=UPI002AB5D158|nr:hypothetical protein [Paenibacillus polymyxa]MDY8095844.1 hypothetical protein [Paenibacillus polymyxa]
MSERIINLPDGLQPMSEEDLQTIWNKADDARGDEAHMSDDVFDLVNALEAAYAQIDSLQQQLVSNNSVNRTMVSRIGELKRQLRVVSLREKMAEAAYMTLSSQA